MWELPGDHFIVPLQILSLSDLLSCWWCAIFDILMGKHYYYFLRVEICGRQFLEIFPSV